MARDSSSKLGCIFTIAMFVYGGYIGFQVIPALYNNTELKGHMDTVARRSPVYKNNSAIVQDILKKARDLEIPITPSDVKISKRPKTIIIQINYEVEFNLLFTKKKWMFSPTVDAPVYHF